MTDLPVSVARTGWVLVPYDLAAACSGDGEYASATARDGRSPPSLADLRVPDEPRCCRAEGGGRGDESDNDGDHEVLPLSAMPASLRPRYRAVPRQCQCGWIAQSS